MFGRNRRNIVPIRKQLRNCLHKGSKRGPTERRSTCLCGFWFLLKTLDTWELMMQVDVILSSLQTRLQLRRELSSSETSVSVVPGNDFLLATLSPDSSHPHQLITHSCFQNYWTGFEKTTTESSHPACLKAAAGCTTGHVLRPPADDSVYF